MTTPAERALIAACLKWRTEDLKPREEGEDNPADPIDGDLFNVVANATDDVLVERERVRLYAKRSKK